MPNEPEHPVEKLLRDAARKRREAAGAPFELHPATRRLLQGEVARQFPADSAPASPFLRMLWPRFALTALGIFVLFIGVVSILPPKPAEKQQLLAKNEDVEEDKAAEPIASHSMLQESKLPAASMPTAAPVALAETAPRRERAANPVVTAPYSPLSKDADKEILTINAVGSVAGVATNLPVETTTIAKAPAPSAAPTQLRRYGLAAEQSQAVAQQTARQASVGGGLAQEPSPTSPQGQALADAMFESKLALAPTVTQRADFVALQIADGQTGFADQDSVRSKVGDASADQRSTLSAANTVMVSFKLEQAGQELRVIDRDGSVYTGPLQQPDTQGLSSRSLTSRTAAPSISGVRAPSPAVPGGYFFQVTGTNRSLNQRVVFTGTLLPSIPLELTRNAATAAGAASRPAPQPGMLPLSNSRISGTLLLGEASIEINAVPAKP